MKGANGFASFAFLLWAMVILRLHISPGHAIWVSPNIPPQISATCSHGWPGYPGVGSAVVFANNTSF